MTEFLKDRVNHDAEWEEQAWAKLLNSNQDILVLMQRLHEKNLITHDMIQMATLPTKPPPRNLEADSKPISVADSHAVPQSAANSMMGGYQSPSMMGGVYSLPHTFSATPTPQPLKRSYCSLHQHSLCCEDVRSYVLLRSACGSPGPPR